MAESKQYITQIQENGNVMISEDVIVTIIAHAVSEVEGVAGLSVVPGNDFSELISVKNWGKSIKITISDKNEVAIDCNILIKYGQSVVDVAAAVQSGVTSAVENMTGVKVNNVNVNVSGISRM